MILRRSGKSCKSLPKLLYVLLRNRALFRRGLKFFRERIWASIVVTSATTPFFFIIGLRLKMSSQLSKSRENSRNKKEGRAVLKLISHLCDSSSTQVSSSFPEKESSTRPDNSVSFLLKLRQSFADERANRLKRQKISAILLRQVRPEGPEAKLHLRMETINSQPAFPSIY